MIKNLSKNDKFKGQTPLKMWFKNLPSTDMHVSEIIDSYENDIFSSEFFYVDPVTRKMNSASISEINDDRPIFSKEYEFRNTLKQWVLKEETIFELSVNEKGDLIHLSVSPNTSFKDVILKLLRVIAREDESTIKYSKKGSSCEGVVISSHFPWKMNCDCKNKHQTFGPLPKNVFTTSKIDSYMTFVNFIFNSSSKKSEEGEEGVKKTTPAVRVDVLIFRLFCKCVFCGEYSSKWKSEAVGTGNK